MKHGFALLTIIFCTIIAVIVLPIACYLWLFPYLHDRTLNNFSTDLTNIVLPQETQKIAELSKVGQQIGNSDHCDYFAGQMFKTGLSKDQFETYYKSHYSGKQKIEFLWINEENDYTRDSQFDPTIIHTLKEWINSRELRDKADVVVYIFEAGMTSDIDYRCS